MLRRVASSVVKTDRSRFGNDRFRWSEPPSSIETQTRRASGHQAAGAHKAQLCQSDCYEPGQASHIETAEHDQANGAADNETQTQETFSDPAEHAGHPRVTFQHA